MADALSRKLHHIYEISFNKVESELLSQTKEAAMKDPEYEFIWQKAKPIIDSRK